MQRTVEIRHARFVDRIGDVLVVMQRQVATIQKVQKTAEFPPTVKKIGESVDVARTVHDKQGTWSPDAEVEQGR